MGQFSNAEPLYIKKGRRYYLWGNTQDRWHRDGDVMRVGSFRLVACLAPGFKRYISSVTPDTASFLAAAEIARHAMEEEIHKMRVAQPHDQPKENTEEQTKIIEKFRADMAATGALVPDYWTYNTPHEIALAGIEAVLKAHEQQTHNKEEDNNSLTDEDIIEAAAYLQTKR